MFFLEIKYKDGVQRTFCHGWPELLWVSADVTWVISGGTGPDTPPEGPPALTTLDCNQDDGYWTIKDIKLGFQCLLILSVNELNYLWHMIDPGVGRKIIRHQFDFLFARKSLTRFCLRTSRFINILTNDKPEVGVAANRKAEHNFDNASGTSELVLESFKVGGWAHVFNWLEEV